MIHDRTRQKAMPSIEAKHWDKVVEAWFEAAQELVEEFDKEGLHETANSIRIIIKQQGKYYGKR